MLIVWTRIGVALVLILRARVNPRNRVENFRPKNNSMQNGNTDSRNHTPGKWTDKYCKILYIRGGANGRPFLKYKHERRQQNCLYLLDSQKISATCKIGYQSQAAVMELASLNNRGIVIS